MLYLFYRTSCWQESPPKDVSLYFCRSVQTFRIQIFHALMNLDHAFVIEHRVEKRFFSRPLINSVVMLVNKYDLTLKTPRKAVIVFLFYKALLQFNKGEDDTGLKCIITYFVWPYYVAWMSKYMLPKSIKWNVVLQFT